MYRLDIACLLLAVGMRLCDKYYGNSHCHIVEVSCNTDWRDGWLMRFLPHKAINSASSIDNKHERHYIAAAVRLWKP
jgi:hypothetical protein